jgi:two-component system cell cycle sensor histidine kinase/response regulator CckA
VYGIMQQHGGQVTCDSQVGESTTFQLFLPVAQTASTPAPVELEPARRWGDETILIVEDEEAVRTTTGYALSRLGYRVLLAVDGEEGLVILTRATTEVDLVLLDLSMPCMSGPEMLEHMDPDNSPPVILFTGEATSHELRDRVAAVLEKPLSLGLLVGCVRSVLDSRQVNS